MLTQIPSHILLTIMTKLETSDLINISKTCKKLKITANHAKNKKLNDNFKKFLNKNKDFEQTVDQYAVYNIDNVSGKLNEFPEISNFKSFSKTSVDSSRDLGSEENLGLPRHDLLRLKKIFYDTQLNLTLKMQGLRFGQENIFYSLAVDQQNKSIKNKIQTQSKFYKDETTNNKEIMSYMVLSSYKKIDGNKLYIFLAICGENFVILRAKSERSRFMGRKLVLLGTDLAERI